MGRFFLRTRVAIAVFLFAVFGLYFWVWQTTADTGVVPSVEDNREAADARRLFSQVYKTEVDKELKRLPVQFANRHEDPDEIMDLLPIEAGQTVADIGCGVGFYTFRLADVVGPTGVVYALDIEEASVSLLKARIDELGDEAGGVIRPILSKPNDPMLPTASVDVGFMAHIGIFVYPKLLEDNAAMLERTFAAIKPGGHLAVIQWQREGRTMAYLSKNMQSVGFVEKQHKVLLYESTYEAPLDEDIEPQVTHWFLFERPDVDNTETAPSDK